MPGLVNGRKRSLNHVLDDEDGSEPGSPLSDNDFGSASKRARLNGHQRTSPSRPVLPDSYRAVQNGGTVQHGVSVHQPGSIVRVNLKNFVTYREAEFLLGPSLNMIIGPNGTGKSTLVCAICLGLGFKTEHLGRSKDLADFVRHGTSEADVEIELAKDPSRHESNPVIRMNIKKAGSRSTFFLDGRNVPRKRILEECKAFSIQIDNLCQFLPQDRVVEFAALNPVDLLAQTLRAAAPEQMTDMHEQLKDLHSDQKRSEDDKGTLSTQLKSLEDRQNLQRTDVERMQQRTTLQEEIRALDLYRPRIEYAEAKKQYEEAKAQKNQALQDLGHLEAEVEPALRAVNDKKKYHDRVAAVVGKRKTLVERSETNAQTLLDKQEEYTNKMKLVNQEISAEKEREKKFKQQVSQIKLKIRDIEVRMGQEPPEFDAATINEQLRGFTRDLREQEEKAEEANGKQQACADRIRRKRKEIADLQKDVAALQTQAGQQVRKLQRASDHTAKAWKWMQENKELFQGPFFGPPIVSCSVKDPRHAIYIENVLSSAEMLSLTVTNRQDFNLLQEKLLGRQGGLNLADIYIRESTVPLSRWSAPVPTDRLPDLGLDAYILDLLDGPEPVLSMLCDNRRIHTNAVSFQDLNERQYEAIKKSPISSYITPTESIVITRRAEYGDQGTSTRTRRTRPPQYFTSASADTSAETEISHNIRDLERSIEELTAEGRGHRDTAQKAGERHGDIKSQQDDLQADKDQRQLAMAEFNALPNKLGIEKAKLEKATKQIADTKKAVTAKNDELTELTMSKGKESLMFATNIQALQKSHIELIEAELLLIEAQSDLETMDSRNTEVRQLLESCKLTVESAKRAQAEARSLAEQKIRKVNEIMDTLSESDNELHNSLSKDMTMDELSNMIESRQASLDMIHEGNPNAMREYEERQTKIDRLKAKLEQTTRECDTYEAKIAAIRQQWEPELDALISKISDAFGDNFSRINCAGHVEVYKADDFSDWSIQIMVKFREQEQLSVLDSHRQSGGERAVSTIFYLMALQSLARAPFRVVDEINQGMDPRNERLVHSRMVDIACAEHTSQYFLITPKLLPGLTYHPKMKIHCIASGEYMPDQQMDFGKLARQALQAQRRISGRV